VTFNYRLGAYGFLSLDDESLHVPGNQAFKDQRMALLWVRVKSFVALNISVNHGLNLIGSNHLIIIL
jgi:hypothetical protein